MSKYILIFSIAFLFGCVSDIQGRPYNEKLECWDVFKDAGSSPRSFSGCNDVLTTAVDENGKAWLFSNSCIPDGFETSNLEQYNEEKVYPSNLCEHIDSK